MKTTLLKSEDYARSPWKNGGGIFTDIADAHRAESNVKDWDSLLWRFAVVNLMGRRGAVALELEALKAPGERRLPAGTHLIYAAHGDCDIRLDGTDFAISHENTLKVELTGASALALVSGLAVLGSIQVVG
jgi:environmental stress-induced protein Ves